MITFLKNRLRKLFEGNLLIKNIRIAILKDMS